MSERFNQAAAGWDKGDMRQNIAQAVFDTMVSRIALKADMDIMDFGAGTGLLSFKIAPMVRSVAGVDLSKGMLEQMQEKNTASLSVEPFHHDIFERPMDRLFDGIVSSMAIHHVEDTARLFQIFHAHLKRDGFIAVADLEAEDGTFHAHGNEGVHHFGFEKEALRQTIQSAGFKNVRFHRAYVVKKEAKEYPVFLVTAMK